MILLLIGFCAVSSTHAQRIKYKDLFPTLDAMSPAERRNALTEYIAADPDHPNANFRLALLYEGNYKAADPLTEIEYVMANADQAKLRFLKSIQLLDEKEILRNNEYYAPLFKTVDSKGKPFVEPSVVARKLSVSYDSAVLLVQRVPPIYQSFTRSVNYYDKAVKEFANVNDNFQSLDDLYLYYDANVEKQLTQLKADFDSARFFFDKYMTLTKAFPIAYHHQKYHIKPITTYRLDGLITRMNFLTNDVELWDYANWVGQVKKSVNTEIAALRSKLIVNEEKLDQSIATLTGFPGKPPVPYKLDKQLIFNLNNYDKQSLVLALLEYKSFKQEWLLKSNAMTVDTVNSMRNAEMYSSLIYANRSADTLVGHVSGRLVDDKIRKHQQFFEKFYGTTEGVKKYAGDEKKFIETTLADYAAGLKSSVIPLATVNHETGNAQVVKMGKLTFSFNPGVITPQRLLTGEPITLEARKNNDGSTYLVGVYTVDKKVNNLVTFVLHVTPDGKPAWVRNFDFHSDSLSKISDANNHPGPMVLTQEGCLLIVRSTQIINAANTTNHAVYLNEKGEEKFRIKLKEKNFPHTATYVERTNSFVIVLKGLTEKQDFTISEPVTMVAINALGDMMWHRNFDVTGTFTDLVHVQDGFMILGNYAIIRDLNGKEHRTKVTGGECSPYLIKLNEKGEVVRVNPLATEKSVYVSHVIKVNDTSINLLGHEATFDSAASKSLSSSENIIHIMVNRHGELVFSIL